MAYALTSPRGNVVYVENENRMNALVARGYELLTDNEPSKGIAAAEDPKCDVCGSTDHTKHPKPRRSQSVESDS